MDRFDESICFGIGVPDHKAIFGTTAGLEERFGPERVFDSPIAEDSLTGFALGAALGGLRPILNHIRVDFLLLSMNQLANAVSSYVYGSNATIPVPITIRAVVGRGWGQGYQHSKSMHATFAHIPGLEVFAPATVAEAYSVTKYAVASNNPTLVLEHRWLYWQEGTIDEKLNIDEGVSLVHDGGDVVLIATSWMVAECAQARQVLLESGLSVALVSVFNLKADLPHWLIQKVEASRATVIADNDWSFSGLGGEFFAQIIEKTDGEEIPNLARIGVFNAPVPTARHLENFIFPDANTVLDAVEAQLSTHISRIDTTELHSHENRFKGPF